MKKVLKNAFAHVNIYIGKTMKSAKKLQKAKGDILSVGRAVGAVGRPL